MDTLETSTAHLADFYRLAADGKKGRLGAAFNLNGGWGWDQLELVPPHLRAAWAAQRQQKEREEEEKRQEKDSSDDVLMDLIRERMIRQMEEDMDHLEELYERMAENRKMMAALAVGLVKDAHGQIDYVFYARSRLDPLESALQPGEDFAAYRKRMRGALVNNLLDEEGGAINPADPLSEYMKYAEKDRKLRAKVRAIEDRVDQNAQNLGQVPDELRGREKQVKEQRQEADHLAKEISEVDDLSFEDVAEDLEKLEPSQGMRSQSSSAAHSPAQGQQASVIPAESPSLPEPAKFIAPGVL